MVNGMRVRGVFFQCQNSVSLSALPSIPRFLSWEKDRRRDRAARTSSSGERESRESAITSMALHHNIYYQLFEKQWQIAPARHRYFDAIPATRLAPAPWNEGKSSSKS